MPPRDNTAIIPSHQAIPDSHKSIKVLLDERHSGWNCYGSTNCDELAQRGYPSCTLGCMGIIKGSVQSPFAKGGRGKGGTSKGPSSKGSRGGTYRLPVCIYPRGRILLKSIQI